MRTKLNHTTKNNPCKICGKVNGNCRYSDNLILCMTLDDQIKGYKNLGYTKDGLWVKYVKDDGSFDHERKERHQRLKEQKEADAIARLKGALLRTERDKYLRVISAHLGLKDEHRQDLINRGLNDQQIKEGLYFSVVKGQNIIPESIPLNFPATSKDYRSNGRKALYSPVTGYACVVFDSFGRAIGLQWRDEDKDTSNKYRWLGRNEASKLKNNELPLNIAQPDRLIHLPENTDISKQNQVEVDQTITHNTALFPDGILKSNIVAVKHQCLTIGAAGGLLSKHPQQLKEAVNQFGIKSIILTPDGGDAINPQVRRRLYREIKFLEKLGLTVSIAWWEQWHKSDKNDIDEINDLSKVKLLTPKEFFKLSTYHAKAKHEWRKSKKFKADRKINQQYLNLETPAPNTITAIASALATGKTTQVIKWLKEFDERIFYLQYRNSLNMGFCEKVNKIYGQWEDVLREPFIYYINDEEKLPRDSQDNLLNLALCLDSLWKINDDDFNDCILILDEIISIIKHLLLSSTLNKNRQLIINKFKEAVKRAKIIILLDGNLTDWAVEYISDIDNSKEVIKIKNTFKPKKQQVFFLNGEYDINKDLTLNIKKNAKSSYYKELLNFFDSCARVGVCADSQVFLETIERLALKNNPDLNILRVDSLTKAEEGFIEIYHNGKIKTVNEVELFLFNPDGYLEKNNIDLLLYSPTCESGVDISIKDYFSAHFCFFFGVLDVDSILQMIKRIRDDIPRYIWVKEFLSNNKPLPVKSCFPDMIGNQIKATLEQELKEFNINNLPDNISIEKILERFNQVAQNSLKSHEFYTENLIRGFQNYEKANLRQCVREMLVNTDYIVEDNINPFMYSDNKEFSNLSDEIKQEKSQDILEADYLKVETKTDNLKKDLQWKRDDRSLSKPDRVGVINLNYRQQLPNIENTEIWNSDLILKLHFKDRYLLSRLELFYLFNNQELLQNMMNAEYFHALKQEKISLHQLRLKHRFINALNAININSVLELESYTKDSPEVIAIYEKLKGNRQLQYDLKISVGAASPCEVVGRILKKINVETRSRRVREGDQVHWFYSPVLPVDPENKILLNCIGQRLSKFSSLNFEVDWSEIPVTEKDAQSNQDDNLNLIHLPENTDISKQNQVEVDQTKNDLWQSAITNIIQSLIGKQTLDFGLIAQAINDFCRSHRLKAQWTLQELKAKSPADLFNLFSNLEECLSCN